MLQNTLIHLQGIGAITEQKLWESGLRHWDSFLDDISVPIPAGRKHFLEKGIEESKRQLYQGNPSYFSKLLPSNQSWRLFPEFRDSAVYLDIETTGLDRYFNDITTIALYDGESIQTYVQGQNLAYNIQDTINLENLMVAAYNMKLMDTPFYETHLITESLPPINPFRADLATINRIKSSSQYWQSQQW